ncbi:hypothetical protein NUW58_g1173 [Xylaria curta]|uniref:Uncharacterized protein n=1 Tax=Xylaria curta TaxID=42375 RepID=A0ACC1PN81_9PEZI|nr:hypothetical protein NUW58_g1173 [Xylaria curta]
MPFPYGMSLHVTVYIAPDNVDPFFAAFKPVYDKVIKEPECMFFEVYEDSETQGVIHWVEDWMMSPESFIEHQITKDYYKDYLAKTEPMFIKPREAKFWQRCSRAYFYTAPK